MIRVCFIVLLAAAVLAAAIAAIASKREKDRRLELKGTRGRIDLLEVGLLEATLPAGGSPA